MAALHKSAGPPHYIRGTAPSIYMQRSRGANAGGSHDPVV